MKNLGSHLNRTVKQAQKLRSRNVELFVSKLNRFLEKQIPKAAKIQKVNDAREAAALLGSLQSSLEEAGLKDVVKGLRKTYIDELSSLSNRFDTAGLQDTFSGFNKATVNALIKNDTKRVTKLISPYIDDVSTTLMRAVIGGEKPDIEAILDSTTEVLQYQIETEVNTMLSSFSRTVSANRAEELGLELFLYVGSNDDKTRDFCREVLDERDPPIYTRDEISRMKNDSGLDVMIYCGGYNCRHQWAALDLEEAKAMGYKPDAD